MLGLLDAADNYLQKIEGKKVSKAAIAKDKKVLNAQLGNLAVALITSMLTSLIMKKILND
jgi:hypothetical protein